MKKKGLRSVAMALVLAMLLQLIPLEAFATEQAAPTEGEMTQTQTNAEAAESESATAEQETAATAEPEDLGEKAEPAQVLFEEKDLREETSKQFRLTDGTFMAVSYGEPVHYQDSQGQWEDIDNTLMLHSYAGAAQASTYETRAGDWTATYAQSIQNNFLFSMERDNFAASFALVSNQPMSAATNEATASEEAEATQSEDNETAATPAETGEPVESQDADPAEAAPQVLSPAEPAQQRTQAIAPSSNQTAAASAEAVDFESQHIQAQILQPEQTTVQSYSLNDASAPTLDEQIMPEKLTSTLLYEDVFSGVDLQYENSSTGIKESILVKSAQSSYVYTFRLDLENLQPTQLDDGGIELRDADDTLRYVIPAPYMVDANDTYSDDVTYTLTQEQDGTYLLTVTADPAWINASQRQFPVAIDPTIIDKTQSSTDSVSATYLKSAAADSTLSSTEMDRLRCGYDTTEGETRILAHVNTLPTIPDGCIMVNAQFGLCQSYELVGTSSSVAIRAFELNLTTAPTSSEYPAWVAGRTWNNMGMTASGSPFMSETKLDYQTLTNSTNNAYTWWDLTTAASKWYEDTTKNQGFVLSVNSAAQLATRVTFRGSNSATGYKPIFAVTYRNITGIESQYSYQNQNVGKAGTAYVGDFNHQLTVVETDTSIDSTITPFTISHVYNTNKGYVDFDYDDDSGLLNQRYSEGKIGAGWKLSVQETCRRITLTDGQYSSYIAYNDADGTIHYFYPTSTNYYEDEDGMGLNITYSVNAQGHTQYLMKDDKNNQKLFYNGYLLQSTDANGNQFYYCYDGAAYSTSGTSWKPLTNEPHYISGVYRKNVGCSVEKLVTLSYQDKYLTSIKNEINGETTTYTYGGSVTTGNVTRKYLTQITFPDNTTAHYEYGANNKIVAIYDRESGYGVEYSYSSKGPHIYNIYEFTDPTGSTVTTKRTTPAEGRTYGQKMHGYRADMYETRYRDYGNNHQADSTEGAPSDDVITQYLFDAWGRTICSYSMDNDRAKMYGAETSNFTNNSGTSKTNNRMTATTAIGIQGTNLLQNSSLEKGSTTAFTAEGWATTDTTSGGRNAVIKTDGPVRTGTRALKMYLSAKYTDTRKIGLYQNVSLEAGKTYTFSGYAKSSLITSFVANDGFYVTIEDANGNALAQSDVIDYLTSTTVENGWQRLQVSYTPQSTGTYRVAVYQSNALGVGAFDDLQLEQESAASSVNLLQDSAMTQNTSSIWLTPVSGAQVAQDTTSKFGANVLKMPASSAQQRRYYQDVAINCDSDSTFVLSGWARANAAPGGVQQVEKGTERYFGLAACITYAKLDTETTAPVEWQYIPFNSFCTQWQYTSGMIVPKKSGRTIASIRVLAAYDYNLNTAYFDQITLTKEPVQTYKYDSNGKLVAANATKNSPQTYTYTGADLTKMVAGGNGTYTYTYDANHRVVTATNDNATMRTNYDSAGNTTSTNWGKSDNTGDSLKSFANYSDDKNQVVLTTDVNNIGNSSVYTNGKLTASRTGTQNQTNYTYYANTKRTKSTYQSGVIALSYDYVNGMLSALSRKSYSGSTANWQTYKFTYDAFGNTTGIRVSGDDNTATAPAASDRQLASYTYQQGVNNGNVSRMSYGNGSYVDYAYDVFGRLISETYYDPDANNAPQFAAKYLYFYASNGDLDKQCQVDANGNVLSTDSFEYDGLDRLIRSRQVSASGTAQRTEHEYDTDNRITSQSWQLRNDNYKQSYSYNNADGAITKMYTKRNGGTAERLDFTYDALKRLTGKANSVYSQSYSFRSIEANRTSTQVSSMSYAAASGSSLAALTYAYTYDVNGNITQVKRNNTTEASYTYDGQGQLTSQTYGGSTHTYTYDTAGNILKESTGSAPNHKVYTYGDGTWKDLLTRFSLDGVSGDLTYDAIGNPTSYFNGSRYNMTWTQGRRLASSTENGTTSSYSYDKLGIRTTKTVGTTTYNYITQNGQVVRQTWAGRTLDIIYDNNNAPYACVYTAPGASPVTYYYLTNQQGDVVRLVTATGATVAEYTYDAWGAPLTSSGAMATINPIRYRGYYYDTESGFYYLQSRYYDPAIGRFINADDAELSEMTAYNVGDSNMFAYCGNNPVSRDDKDGEFWNIVVGGIVGGLIGGIVAGVTSYVQTGKVDWGSVAINTVVGATNGVIAATGLGALAQAGITAGISGLGNAAEQIHKNKGFSNFNAYEVVGSALVGGATSLIGTGVGKIVGRRLNKVGNELLKKGRDKLLTGVVRRSVGQSHSALIRQGTRYISRSMIKFNTFRGLSSVVGSWIGGGTSIGYGRLKRRWFR